MADARHLAILQQGVDAWNDHRRAFPDDRPDFSAADLSGSSLAWVDFSGADLSGCNLRGSDLTESLLQGAELTGAQLVCARLDGARLGRARLMGALFTDAASFEGQSEQYGILRKGPEAWYGWRNENPGLPLQLPEDTFLAKLVWSQRAFQRRLASTAFEGNAEHLALLHSGVEPWNAWRRQDPETVPDLRGAQFVGAELRGVNLSLAKLDGALLTEADLRDADLTGASLCQAQLSRADLGYSKLTLAGLLQADLLGADLGGADLSRADLSEAELAGARLHEAQLDDARLGEADFFEGHAGQLAMLCADQSAWNAWRIEHPDAQPDLRGANLTRFSFWDADLSRANLARAHLSGLKAFRIRLEGADLRSAKLIDANLFGANLAGALLEWADLRRAVLTMANLSGTQFFGANLEEAELASANLDRAQLQHARLGGARLRGAHLQGADLRQARLDAADLRSADLTSALLVKARLTRAFLSKANLTNADLSEADLSQAVMVESVVDGASLSGARVYGVSAWGLDMSKVRDQSNLLITPDTQPALTVDNLELAQFVYLMLSNEKIRGIIDTVGRKAVLILGRFYGERKAVLDALKATLRTFDLVPMVFDWDKPTSRDLTETVALLANMSRFVVADVTDAKSIPQELAEIVPRLPSVPVQPILLMGDRGYAMFEHWKGYRTMLPVFEYRDQAHLIDHVRDAVIEPIEQWEAGAGLKSDMEAQLREEIERLRAALLAKELAR